MIPTHCCSLLFVKPKMFARVELFFVILSTSSMLIQAEDVNQTLVNYYVKLIENHTLAAQNYKLPTDARMFEPENKTVQEYGEYDFIVIGAGSTGCITANRLSEEKKWSVLLLEAGTYPDKDLTRIPALFPIDGQTKFNWGYRTIPQKYSCLSNPEQRCDIQRGKGVGGTSLINGLMYVRGNRLDYNRWSELLFDPSFRYESLFPYFLKTENFTRRNPFLPIDFRYHGYRGPLHVSQSIPAFGIERAVIEAAPQLGYLPSDYNGPHQVGVNIIQYYLLQNGFRDDPGLAFIKTARNRKNLHVLDQSFVIKLDISNTTKRINGVIFTRNNKTYIARNRKEVILSAGSVGSPQILMLSGIGPEDHLQSLGIPVIRNLPVGKILHDHTFSNIFFSSNITFPNTTELAREFVKGRGLLTSGFSLNAILSFKVPKGLPGDIPDAELIFANNLGPYPDDVPNPFSIILGIYHLQSKGTLKLKSADPYEYPLIDSNLLSDDGDMELLYEAFMTILKLIETEPFRKLNVTLAPTEASACNHSEPMSKEYWYCYLRRVSRSGGHLISTCLTGTSPQTGVVDNRLRVFGVKDLRVADASVVPFSIANHPTATCSVIAEKISNQIKADHLFNIFDY